ncbi:hypothetical protein YpsIP31758_4109 [Yersinia pseudotuberculosis IP 31758]|uniref:Uncharacterized protein n=1 Tax=Yersinia pseudotuberculosis serotype O:1b (strain IP 31758) TaxID=349747 RepID=A0A0U1QUY9_YERP3|nr:hypothetical protein YpsIP31758_4109 [Yersinia pseudotuberculosis IP 31758]
MPYIGSFHRAESVNHALESLIMTGIINHKVPTVGSRRG